MKQTIELYKRWKADPSKGEVFTPSKLVCEMLDRIPINVWKNPNSTFLDPCMGKGTFIIEIISRLINIYGYSKEDAVSRVFGYDTCVKYINHLKRGGFVNVFHKDFLNEKLNMKFDVVVGNPPYQENSEKGKSKGGGKNVMRGYALFVNKSMESLKENGNLFYIIPQGWQVSTHALWKLITSKYSLNYIDNNNQKLQEFFGNVGSTFCVINVKNEQYLGKTNIEGYGDINLKKIPTLSDSSNIILFEKTITTFLTEGVSKLNFVGDSTFHYQKQTTKDNLSLQQDHEYIYPIKHTSSKTFYSKINHPAQNTMKVIISDSGYLSPIFDNGEYGVTQHSPYMKVNSVEEGTKIVNFLKSDKIQELLKLTKKSGFYNINVINSLSYE